MKYKTREDQTIRKYCNNLPVRELLKLVICPNIFAKGTYDYNEYKGIPSIFIHPNKIDLINKVIDKINDVNKDFKTIFVTDMEAGPGTALQNTVEFTSLRGAAETKDESLCYQMGLSASYIGRKAGFLETFGPVVDILGDVYSPIMSLRSAGETKEDVLKYAYAYYKGIEDGGMTSTIKHFPGDGYCANDQHLTTPTNPLTKDEWDSSFGVVFKTFIDEGVKSIMPGHISLPCYDELDEETGIYPPATLSYNLLTKLLKEKLGFEGLIISDAVNMGGFAGYMNIYKACAKFLSSGGDTLLFMHPTEEYFQNMEKLIKDGYLDLNILKDRAYRNLIYVQDQTITKPLIEVDSQNVSQKITSLSVKVYRDRYNLLPLEKQKKILHVDITTQIDESVIFGFNDELKKYAHVTYLKDPGCDNLVKIAKSDDYDYIICSVGNKHAYGTNQIKLSGYMARNMMGGWTKFKTPVVFVSFMHPYIHLEYQAIIDTLIYTYGYTSDTPNIVCKTIFKA